MAIKLLKPITKLEEKPPQICAMLYDLVSRADQEPLTGHDDDGWTESHRDGRPDGLVLTHKHLGQ